MSACVLYIDAKSKYIQIAKSKNTYAFIAYFSACDYLFIYGAIIIFLTYTHIYRISHSKYWDFPQYTAFKISM